MDFLFLVHTSTLFLASLTFLAAGLLVFLKRPKERGAAFSNSLWSLSVSFWAFFMALGMIFGNNIIFKISWIFIFLIPVTNVQFVVTWLGIERKNLFVKLGYIFVAVLGLLYIIGANAEVQAVGYAQYFPKVTGILYIGSVVFIIYTGAQFYYLYTTYRISSGIKRRQVGYLLLASALGYFGGLSNYLMAFGIFIPYYHPFAGYFLIFYPLITTYVILKYHLFDIKLIIRKALLYSVGIALLAGFLVGISFLSNLLAKNIPGFNFWVVPVVIAVISFIFGKIFWEKSKETEKLKYEFITVAAHKLRTPLTEIKWALDFLSENRSQEDMKAIATIRRSTERLLELTDQLLAVSNAERTQGYDFKTVRIEEITTNALKDFESRIHEKNIQAHVHFEHNLPLVKVDVIRITSVIQALLENAIAYTKDRININIYNYKNKIIFSIEDNGIGIEKEDQERIFSKMYRTHDAYLSETEGEGLSLYLAKNIIERHDGKLKVKSEGKNKGSKFLFELPV